jgi:phage virion morphogenesis protein|nr:MAG TPA: virion morphogenesis protein [Caudoviricetes sp.]
MVGVVVKITDKDVAERLKVLQKKIGNLEPFFKNAGEILLENTNRRFVDEVDPDGNKWKALSDSYKEKKKGHKILQELGENGGLLGTLNYHASPAALLIGSVKVYAAVHQTGGDAGRNHSSNIPARSYLGLSEKDKTDLNDLISDFLEEN